MLLLPAGIPNDVWLEVFSFVENPLFFITLRQLCRYFKDLLQTRETWSSYLRAQCALHDVPPGTFDFSTMSTKALERAVLRPYMFCTQLSKPETLYPKEKVVHFALREDMDARTDLVKAMEFFPGGRFCITFSEAGRVRLWDLGNRNRADHQTEAPELRWSRRYDCQGWNVMIGKTDRTRVYRVVLGGFTSGTLGGADDRHYFLSSLTITFPSSSLGAISVAEGRVLLPLDDSWVTYEMSPSGDKLAVVSATDVIVHYLDTSDASGVIARVFLPEPVGLSTFEDCFGVFLGGSAPRTEFFAYPPPSEVGIEPSPLFQCPSLPTVTTERSFCSLSAYNDQAAPYTSRDVRGNVTVYTHARVHQEITSGTSPHPVPIALNTFSVSYMNYGAEVFFFVGPFCCVVGTSAGASTLTLKASSLKLSRKGEDLGPITGPAMTTVARFATGEESPAPVAKRDFAVDLWSGSIWRMGLPDGYFSAVRCFELVPSV